MIGVILCLAIPLVLALMASVMRSAGASLRPIVFLASLMLPIAVIFLIGSLVTARLPTDKPEATFNLPVSDGHFVDREKLFGADLPSDQLRDAKGIYPQFLTEAEVAELAIVGISEAAVVAQFPSADAAKRAATALWQTFQVYNTSGDEQRGWRGQRRPNSDYIEVLRIGRHLLFWTAPSKSDAADLRAKTMLPFSSKESGEPLIPALQPLGTFFKPVGVKVIGMLLLAVLYTVWFFKGATWAGSSPAMAGVTALPASELAARLGAINTLDAPFRIERGSTPNEFFATWRYADAKWIDLARTHGLQRTFRIRLTLDESAHTIRATDYAAGYEWSAGGNGAQIEWKAVTGIVFFQTEQGRVFGLQLDDQGHFKPELPYTYQFNLAEMKSPLITATTRSGWTWRPTVWQGPVWLRWLTE